MEAAADRLDERGCDVGVVGLIAFDDADLMVFRESDDTGDMVTQVHDPDDVAKDGGCVREHEAAGEKSFVPPIRSPARKWPSLRYDVVTIELTSRVR